MAIIGLDGTHLMGEMHKRGIYLVATTKDFNSHIVVFGLALVSVENYENWHWFLKQLRTAIASPIVIGTAEPAQNPMFVSDRQKGLLASIENVFPHSGHRYCLRHIIGDISKLGSVLTPSKQAMVFAMARAESENDFNYEMARLAETRQKAADCLAALDKEHWVTYAFQEKHATPTFDEVTSNMSESANNWIGNDTRSSHPLHAFEQYMIKVVEQFALRRREASRGMASRTLPIAADDEQSERASTPWQVMASDFEIFVTTSGCRGLVPHYAKKLDGLLRLSKTCDVMPCLDGLYMVRFIDPSSRPGHIHVWRAVDLKGRECTCKKWQDERFPCIHAVRAAERSGTPLSELFDWEEHSVLSYTRTYNYQFVIEGRVYANHMREM